MSKQQVGPVKLSGLVDLYQTGSRGGIVDDTLLWSERMAGWTKLKVCVCPFCSSVASPLSPVLACTGRQDFPELQGHLQGEGRSRQVVETQGESSTTQALMTKPPAKAPGSSGVRGFLLGWLPKRAPPEHLVKRGILREDPTRQAHGGRKGSVPASKALPKHPANAIFGNSLTSILQRPDTKDGIPAVVRILMGKLLMDGAAGLKHEGIFRGK